MWGYTDLQILFLCFVLHTKNDELADFVKKVFPPWQNAVSIIEALHVCMCEKIGNIYCTFAFFDNINWMTTI